MSNRHDQTTKHPSLAELAAEALEEPLSRMDSAALVRDFISLAWKALESAVAVFDELLVINEVGR